MIETRYGNALDVNVGIIVHGCNCQGVMGGGFALEVKNRFPLAFHEYDKVHRTNGLNTQEGFGGSRRNVSYDAVADCFSEVYRFAKVIEQHRGVKLDVIFPAIGAGLGGGDWKIISAIIDVVIPDHDLSDKCFKKILYLLPKD